MGQGTSHDLVIRGGTVVDGTGGAPRSADVAIDAGVVTEIGAGVGRGRQEIDADGALVTPGWVDVHTHYDGQVTWDPELAPSSWHGVTTLVMGNCGVGFAPARPDGHDFLVELMEGVEDIPGSALHEGLTWDWESFPEYLDAVAATRRTIDVAAQVPHCAVRAYVMGDRAHEEPDADEIVAIARIVEEGLRAGAVGFSTSRTILHTSKHGLVPGTTAAPDELLAIAEAIAAAGHGVFEMVSDSQGGGDELPWLTELGVITGQPVTCALAQTNHDPEAWRQPLAGVDEAAARGARFNPQVSCRPTGMLFGLQSSLHPFISHPTWHAAAHLTHAERVAYLRANREQLLAEETRTSNRVARSLMQRWEQMFPLGDEPDYEPPASASAAAVAAREGRRPEEVVLDWLLEADGKALVFAPLASYAHHNHDVLREMMLHPATIMGLSDGGAHCGLICDASMPTYLLTHWARDRHRGERLPLEYVVHLQTQRTARTFGFHDRGVLAPGMKADVNVIDHDGLRLHAPEMVFDLPAQGRRLIQRVDGYVATVVSGEVTFRHGEATGARPGALVRG